VAIEQQLPICFEFLDEPAHQTMLSFAVELLEFCILSELMPREVGCIQRD